MTYLGYVTMLLKLNRLAQSVMPGSGRPCTPEQDSELTNFDFRLIKRLL
jgi:hypothetical protein